LPGRLIQRHSGLFSQSATPFNSHKTPKAAQTLTPLDSEKQKQPDDHRASKQIHAGE
jgi:hypothetical protein